MKPIRTEKGKLFGTIDIETAFIHIRDGKNLRLIKIPPDGLTVQFISKDNTPETIFVQNEAKGDSRNDN